MPRRSATGVVCIFLIWGLDDVCIVLFSVKPLTVTCAGLSLSLVLIVVFLVVRDRSKRKVLLSLDGSLPDALGHATPSKNLPGACGVRILNEL